MPTLDGAEFVGAAMDSLCGAADGSSRERFEVLVLDDGSRDGTRGLVAGYRDLLDLELMDGAGGWVASTQRGLQRARGRYCCFLHQDDLWLDDRWPSLLAHLDRTPDLDLLLGPSRLLDATGQSVGVWRAPLRAGEQESAALVERLLVQNVFAVPAPVFRTEALLAAGGLDLQLWYTADWDAWLRLAATCRRVVYDPEPHVGFRIHSESQTLVRSRGGLREQLEVVLARHLGPQYSKAVRTAARLSVEINDAMARLAGGSSPEWRRLLGALARSFPGGWWRYLRWARLGDRMLPRLRLRWSGGLAPGETRPIP